MDRLPVLLVSGFLGAGKTSVLAHLLAHDPDLRPAVLVNDPTSRHLGVRPIEERLQAFPAQSSWLLKLTAGCICCSLRGLFLQIVARLAEQNFNYLLIETAGAAEAGSLVDVLAANSRPGSSGRSKVSLDALATVVDARHFLDNHQAIVSLREIGLEDSHGRRSLGNVLRQQVEKTHVLILNKLDLVTAEEQQRLEELPRQLNPKATLIPALQGRVDPRDLLHIKDRPPPQPDLAADDALWQSPQQMDLQSLLPAHVRLHSSQPAQAEPEAPPLTIPEPTLQAARGGAWKVNHNSAAPAPALASPPASPAAPVEEEPVFPTDLPDVAEEDSLVPNAVHVDPIWADSGRFPPFTLVEPGEKQLGINAFATLPAALLAVAPGGVVYVAAGTYPGGLRIDRSVQLIGDKNSTGLPVPGAQAPVIDCSRSETGEGITIEEGIREVTIEGFVITGLAGPGATGISTRGAAQVRIRHNHLSNLGRGIDLDGALTTGWVIEHNLFKGRDAGPDSVAVRLGEDLPEEGSILIRGNEIEQYGHAVRVLGRIPIDVAGNRLSRMTRAVLALKHGIDEWHIHLDGNDIEPADGTMIEYLDRPAAPQPPEPPPPAEPVVAEPPLAVLVAPVPEPAPEDAVKESPLLAEVPSVDELADDPESILTLDDVPEQEVAPGLRLEPASLPAKAPEEIVPAFSEPLLELEGGAELPAEDEPEAEAAVEREGETPAEPVLAAKLEAETMPEPSLADRKKDEAPVESVVPAEEQEDEAPEEIVPEEEPPALPEPSAAAAPLAVEPILLGQGSPCLLDLSSLLDSPDDAGRRYVLHWGDDHARVYFAEELRQLSGLLLHTYTSAGLYTIALDVEDEAGLHRNVAVWPVAVFAPQVVGPLSGRVGQPSEFRVGRPVATDEGPPCFSWQVRSRTGQLIQQVGWTWSDPQPILAFTPVEPGWYTILLTIQDGEGNLSKVERSLHVREVPKGNVQ